MTNSMDSSTKFNIHRFKKTRYITCHILKQHHLMIDNKLVPVHGIWKIDGKCHLMLAKCKCAQLVKRKQPGKKSIRKNSLKSYFSCPAVSHIDILTALPSTLIFLFKNDAYWTDDDDQFPITLRQYSVIITTKMRSKCEKKTKERDTYKN